MRKGDFSHQLVQGFLRLETTSLDVGEVIEDILARGLLLLTEMDSSSRWDRR